MPSALFNANFAEGMKNLDKEKDGLEDYEPMQVH